MEMLITNASYKVLLMIHKIYLPDIEKNNNKNFQET